MPPFSFAHLPQICPPARAQRPFPSHWFRREAGGRRQGEPPSKAGQRSAGENGADGFLCHSPFSGLRLSKKWLAPLFRGVHSSLAPTARPGSYARKPLLRKAFCGFDAHVAKSDQSLRGLRPPTPRGFFDRLRPPACAGGLTHYGKRDCSVSNSIGSISRMKRPLSGLSSMR